MGTTSATAMRASSTSRVLTITFSKTAHLSRASVSVMIFGNPHFCEARRCYVRS